MGARANHKIEAGSGGKRGHSNMDHWITTDEIKKMSRRLRRMVAKKEIREQLRDDAPQDRD